MLAEELRRAGAIRFGESRTIRVQQERLLLGGGGPHERCSAGSGESDLAGMHIMDVVITSLPTKWEGESTIVYNMQAGRVSTSGHRHDIHNVQTIKMKGRMGWPPWGPTLRWGGSSRISAEREV